MHRIIAFVTGIAISTASASYAAVVELEFIFEGPDQDILVDGISTPIPSGVQFDVMLDPSTPDSNVADITYGSFLADQVLFTAPDIGLFNAVVDTPIEYFEDSSPIRLGLADITANSALALFTNDISQIGDPKVIDTLPDFSTNTASSGGSTSFGIGFGFQLEDNTTVSFGNASFANGSVAPVPLPPAGLLLLLSVAGIARLRLQTQSGRAG